MANDLMTFNDTERALHQYADIKSQIKVLEDQLDELKPQVIDYIDEGGGKAYELSGKGTFLLQSRTTYEYSEKLQKKADLLKKEQEVEQLKGIATVKSISQSLVWRGAK